MWQRFTAAARKIVFNAQEEAQRYGDGHVNAEHLLLGLLRETECTACEALERLGKRPKDVALEVEELLAPANFRARQDMILAPRAKRIIDLAYEEAREMDNNFIGTEHLLLGLIREDDGKAAEALGKLGITLVAARSAVAEAQRARMERKELKEAPPEVDPVVQLLRQKLLPGEIAIPSDKAAMIARTQMVLIVGSAAQVKELGKFLRALDLLPINWKDAHDLSPELKPEIREVFLTVLTHAAATIIVLPNAAETLGDGLNPVDTLFAAGIAYGMRPSKAILIRPNDLVTEDHLASHALTLSNDESDRVALIDALKFAGCSCITKDDVWKTAGDFGDPA